MLLNARHTLFTQFLAKEAWDFHCAKKWMIELATERPMSTIILFENLLSRQP
jgi:hypothetical protein